MISCAISPCPNDIWTFSGLLSRSVATNYEFRIGTIGELNQWAENDEVAIAKISAGCYPHVKNRYAITSVGASFGTKTGPKLVVRKEDELADLNGEVIGTPSLTSSASFVLQKLFPQGKQVRKELFEIPKLVQKGEIRCAIVVNEAMNELEKYGLKIHLDLAQEWKNRTGTVLPLGLVVASKRLTAKEISVFEQDVRNSIQWAIQNDNQSIKEVLKYSNEKDELTVRKHIANFTVNSDDNHFFKQAIQSFLDTIEKDTF